MNSADQSPWICPNCGHFCVLLASNDAPTHNCAVVGRDVDLVPYIDSAQAMRIRDNAVSKAAAQSRRSES